MPDKEGTIQIRDQELRGLHEILLTTLNVSEVSLFFDSRELWYCFAILYDWVYSLPFDFPEIMTDQFQMIRQSWSVDGVPVATLQGYLSLLRDLVSGGIRDVTVLRRERLLR
jgi:hypothetical protein